MGSISAVSHFVKGISFSLLTAAQPRNRCNPNYETFGAQRYTHYFALPTCEQPGFDPDFKPIRQIKPLKTEKNPK